MDDLTVSVIAALLVVVLILGVSIVAERRRISRLFVKAGTGGLEFSVELHELVQREVNKATTETLRRIVTLDQKIIEYWERESIHRYDDSEPKLRLLEENVEQIERAFSSAPETEKPHLGFVLREMYWAYLRHARDHYASSEPYQKIRNRVMEGLERLGAL